MKQPCAKDCPDRSPECHSVCEKYLAYNEQNSIDRDRRLAESRAQVVLSDMSVKRSNRYQRSVNHEIKIPNSKFR